MIPGGLAKKRCKGVRDCSNKGVGDGKEQKVNTMEPNIHAS